MSLIMARLHHWRKKSRKRYQQIAAFLQFLVYHIEHDDLAEIDGFRGAGVFAGARA
ncbi:MAG TPA: hypothetical protein VMY41_07700 [Thermohalobaculum sp.]|nr:hypothetical protein [Thermohalobaculum sp.]